MSIGIIYVATGQKFVEEACVSAASVKKHNPEILITGFFDQNIESQLFEQIKIIDSKNAKKNKVHYIRKSPYKNTLFLDTDTYICSSITEMFTLLNKFDIAVAHAPFRKTIELQNIPESFPEFNTGVILFKKTNNINILFKNWEDLYVKQIEEKIMWRNPSKRKLEILKADQPSFRQAIFESNVRIATLLPEYNCRFAMPGYVDQKVKILHGRNPNLEQVQVAINYIKSQRIYLPDKKLGVKLIQEKREKNLLFNILNKVIKRLKQFRQEAY